MNLNADLSYTYEASGKLSGTTAATANDSATFSKSGSTITFTSNFLHGMTYAATASDTSFSVVLIGVMLGSTDNTIPVLFLKER